MGEGKALFTKILAFACLLDPHLDHTASSQSSRMADAAGGTRWSSRPKNLKSGASSIRRRTASTVWYSIALLCMLFGVSNAYIPAVPSNDTSFINSGSYLQINLMSETLTANPNAISRQLVNFRGVTGYRGAFVHFSEDNVTTTAQRTVVTVPWIALIDCDTGVNGTDVAPAATQSEDIFSSVRRLSAQAVILYSGTGRTCLIDPTFARSYNGSYDVYVTTSRTNARAIDEEFVNVSPEAYYFDANALNGARDSIAAQIGVMGAIPAAATSVIPASYSTTSGAASPTSSSSSNSGSSITNYLIATISHANMQELGTTQTGADAQQQSNRPNTGLAMIILYAITGFVTLLFLVVILSGAVRAMRHPERYGPRARNLRGPGDNGQSRAGGLTKAILDTFPVVKYLGGQSGTRATDAGDGASQNERDVRMKDEEEAGEFVEAARTPDGTHEIPMHTLRSSQEGRPSTSAEGANEANDAHHREISDATTLASPAMHLKDGTSTTTVDDSDTSGAKEPKAAPAAAVVDTTDPNDVNDSVTCPICLLDFEDGDDIRILPCNSKHRFHDACVVPWLLNVSSLCPLCRLDLAATANTTATIPEEQTDTTAQGDTLSAAPPTGTFATIRARLSRTASTLPGAQGQDVEAATSAGAVQQETQAPSRSGFLRYVQQRRTRVRTRANSRSMLGGESGPAPPPPAAPTHL